MLNHSTSFNTSKTYNLHGNLKLSIDIKDNLHTLSPDALFEMAIRINKKRQFLFISRLLGKHLAVDPTISLGTGSILASMLMESEINKSHPRLSEIVEMVNSGVPNRGLSVETLKYKTKLPTKTLFIGFAETATGLGHAVFNHFQDAHYIHTTREELADMQPSFYFEEEHSHATSHRVYASENVLLDAETIVLIDDEITSGLTITNLIIALNKSFPGKRYKILSILDWRSNENQKNFAKVMDNNGISAEVISLLSGQFSLLDNAVIEEPELNYLDSAKVFEVLAFEEISNETTSQLSSTHSAYSKFTGRFGLTSSMHDKMDLWVQTIIGKLTHLDREKSTLIIGIGENIYIPQRFALKFGSQTKVQTTTRSPIFAKNEKSYPIKHTCKFILPDSNGIDQYLYNLSDVEVEQIIVIAESVSNQASWFPLLTHLESIAPVTWLSLTLPNKRGELNGA